MSPFDPRTIQSHHKSVLPYCLLVTALLIAFASGSAASEDDVVTITPGDPRITEDTTRPHTSRWAMTRLVPGKAPEQRGVWLDRHSILDINGRKLHKFQSDVIWTEGRPRRDIVFWDQRSMETTSAELENYNNKGGWAYFVYDQDRVSQVYRREQFGETFSESRRLERRVFELGHGLVFVNILSLRPGGKVRYPYHSRSSDEVKWVTLEAVEYQEIDTPQFGSVKTLLIASSLGWRYWTVPEPPYVYRLDIPIPKDGVDRWELLEYIVDKRTAPGPR